MPKFALDFDRSAFSGDHRGHPMGPVTRRAAGPPVAAPTRCPCRRWVWKSPAPRPTAPAPRSRA
jgi:hypothetical protein